MKSAVQLLDKVLVRFFLTLSACGWSVPATSQQLPDMIDRVRPSIVQVSLECVHSNNSKEEGGGTAFLVSKEGYALTAAHVVTCPQTALLDRTIKVGLPVVYSLTDQAPYKGNFTFIDAELIERDDTHDVALLKLSRNPFQEEIQSGFTRDGKALPLIPLGVASLSIRTLREGEPVAASGYPFLLPVLVTDAGIIASTRFPHVFTSRGEGVQIHVTSDFYFADLAVNPGNSGSPVYDASGKVVGIVTAFQPADVVKFVQGAWQQTPRAEGTSGYNSHLAVIVPILHANTLLAKHAVVLPSQ